MGSTIIVLFIVLDYLLIRIQKEKIKSHIKNGNQYNRNED